MIFADALVRIADKAHPPRRQIVQPAEPVEDLAARRIGIERVHREIAAGGIVLPISGEGDRRPAAVGADVMAQGGDLDRPLRQHRRNRAVLDARGHGLDACILQPLHHGRRLKRGGNVHVLDRDAEQGVAHRAADVAGISPAKRGNQRGEVGAPSPVNRGKGGRHHAIRRDRL